MEPELSTREHSGLLTDLYELTMAAGYLQTGFDARATFELFVRSLPKRRNYLVAAGLEQCLDFLENVNFTVPEIDFLRRHPVFRNIRDEFFDYLAKFRFTGDVWAMPEGTLAFAGEPVLVAASCALCFFAPSCCFHCRWRRPRNVRPPTV